MAYENLSPEELAAKFGGVPVDQGPNLEALAQKFGGKPDVYDPTSGMSVTDKVLAGIGKGFVDVGRGLGQRVGLVDQAAIDESRKYDAPLMGTKSGVAGNFVGNIAAFAPAAFIPGANTVAGAAAIGGLQGLTQPTQAGESAKSNALMGSLFGGASQAVLGSAAKAAGNYLNNAQAKRAILQSQNAERDATLSAAQAAGFRVPPSTINPTFLNQRLESLAGKAAVQQEVSNTNAAVADRLVRQTMDLPENAPITTRAMRQIRRDAYKEGYAPVAALGKVQASPEYNAALDAINAKASNTAQSFPGAARPDIAEVVDSFRPPEGVFDAAHAIDASQQLRNQARDLFRLGNSEMAQTKLAISRELENELERQLTAQGQNGAQALNGFRAARQRMAMAHDVEDAIREGSGSTEARVFGRKFQNGEPLSGNLETIGRFANVFPKANQPVSQIGSPGVSALEASLAGLMGTGGAIYTGDPKGAALGLLPVLARPAARGIVVSQAMQKLLAQPQYANLLLPRAAAGTLGLADQAALGGLLGPYLANAAQ